MGHYRKLVAIAVIWGLIFSLIPGITIPSLAADPAPEITSISPDEGLRTGGTKVTIYGANFVPGSVADTRVYFGSEQATVDEVQSDRVVVYTPSYPQAAVVDVKVVNPDGQSVTKGNGFTFVSTPTVTGVSPDNGTSIGGTSIVISGTEFQNGASVYVGDKLATDIVVENSTQISAVTPSGPLGYQTVRVVNPDGGSGRMDNAFLYTKSTPAIQTVTPSKGSGGTEITITGEVYSEFDAEAQVKVGDNYASNVQVISPREIHATVPPGNVDGTKKSVTVINPDGASDTLADAFEYIIMPFISSITPNYGSVGDTVTIKGANFDKISNLVVVIGGFEATILDQTGDTLQVQIVEGNVGPADVTVMNRLDPEQGVTVEDGFTFSTEKSQPQITGINPNVGSTKGGDEVTISGQDFRISADGSLPRVTFAGKDATIKTDINGEPYVTSTQIVVITPEHSAGYADVTVTNPDGGTVTVDDGFTYKIPEKMVRITSVTPDKGTVEGGTPFTLHGVNFPNQAEWESGVLVEVFIGGNPATGVTVTTKDGVTTVSAVTPGGYVEEGQIETAQDVMINIVRTVDGQTKIERDIMEGGFTYRIPESYPEITAVENTEIGDNTGPLEGGSPIKITGNDFRSGAQVYLGKIDEGHEAVVTSVTTTEILAVTPAGEKPGPVDVIVVNPDLGTAVLHNGFVYKGTTMVVTSITPNFGPVSGGSEVKIAGANFNEDENFNLAWPVRVYLADEESRYEADIVDVDLDYGTYIIIRTPKHTPGLKDVIVANRYGEYVYTQGFDYRLPSVNPAISAVTTEDGTAETPARGPVTGGTAFTITGMNFTSGASVLVGGVPASDIIVHSDTKITAVTPAGLPGFQDVTVTNATGDSDTLEGGFFYYSTPSIQEVNPDRGSIFGGNIISITGQQFYEGAQVVVGSVYAQEVRVFDNQLLKFRLPPGNSGKADITIINVDGGSVTWEGFEYVEPAETVTINQVKPSAGPTEGGTQVTVQGSGFAPDAIVYFGWEKALSIEVISPTEIKAIAPPNEAGTYPVTVTNTRGTGTAVLQEAFQYKLALTDPRITGVYPDVGPVDGGVPVTIVGEDFWPGAVVLFNDVPATQVKVTSNTIIEAVIPAGEVGPAEVQVMNPDGGQFVLEDGFMYKYPDSSPTIDGVQPDTVSTHGGTWVTVTGSDFRDNLRVFFGAVESPQVVIVDSTTLRAETPAHQPGSYNVIVVNDDGGVAVLYDGITYLEPQSEPVITAIEPDKGWTSGGTAVTITGKDFRQGAEVYFNGVPATDVIVVDYKTIMAVTPPGEKGKADVTVINTGANLGSFTLKDGFTYQTTVPEITAVLPSMGSREGGDQVVIAGQDFLGGAKVYIGQVEASVLEVESGRITIITPPSDTIGSRDVKVLNPDGAEAILASGFTYKVPDSDPTISRLDPDKGPTTGGLYVTISGTDFRDGAQVYFGGRPASDVRVLTDKTIMAKVPAHTAGIKDVTVMNDDGGSYTLPNGFTYQVPLSEPVITAVTPAEGPTIGGTTITLTGKDFRNGAKVYIDGMEAADVTVVNYKTITAVTPPGSEGPKEVTVVNQDQGIYTLQNGFNYIVIPLPTISAIEPSQGPASGGTSITITGTNFQEGATVLVGGQPATNVVVVDKTRITAVTPAGDLGWQPVKVINPDTGWVEEEGGFYYYRPRSAPDDPGWLSAYGHDAYTVKLRFGRAEFANYYAIYVSDKYNGTYRYLDQTNKTTYYVTGLKPDTKYYFKVRAVNELGVSNFTGYDYARTKKLDEEEEEEENIPEQKTSIKLSNAVLDVSIPSIDALWDLDYRLDLSAPEYGNARQVNITVAYHAARRMGGPLVVDTGDVILSLPAQALNPTGYQSLTTRELEDAWVRITLEDAGLKEAEALVRALPGNLPLASRVYSISSYTVVGKKETPNHILAAPVTVTMANLPAELFYGRQKPRFYVSNSSGLGYESVETVSDTYWRQATMELSLPGNFTLVRGGN